VDRSEFDRVLLEHARSEGARVLEEHQVVKFRADLADGVEVTVRDAAGDEVTARARMLVDASGQSALVASRLGLREMEPELRNFAVFSHFEGAARASGPSEGDISIVLAQEGWWWVIAEGIDKSEQLTFLKREGCDEGQGYLISSSLPANAMRKFLGSFADTGSALQQTRSTLSRISVR
jgi:2-polyprenyl-6-methoxyphenol hydroxylase-like FAD-dependent oxidoreductase